MNKFISARKVIILAAAAFFPFFVSSNSAQAELNCEPLSGKWSGNMRGAFAGATSMKIKKCRVSWRLPDGRLNRCRYNEKQGKVEYQCSLGSRGVVKINGNSITMQNVYTARQHGAYTANFKKQAQ